VSNRLDVAAKISVFSSEVERLCRAQSRLVRAKKGVLGFARTSPSAEYILSAYKAVEGLGNTASGLTAFKLNMG
jgi:hypothetical protein